jgi:membrane-associated protein
MTEIISLLETYRYLIIFPLGIIEGPILSVICGFLVTIGYLNWYFAYPALVLADALGDWIYYAFGRFGLTFVLAWGPYVGITSEKLEKAREYFITNHFKMVAASKLIHAGGAAGLVAAGTIKIPFFRFAAQCFLISVLQTGFLFLLGVFFGRAYSQIAQYLNYYAAGTAIVVLIAATYLLIRWARPRE